MKNNYNAVAKQLEMIKLAVEYQAKDPAIWNPQTIGEAYLVQALRDLHRVIEDQDEQALANIKDCIECAS